MKIKIQIKSILGKILFEFEKENNTVKETVLKAIEESADLRSANLRSANLESANLESANLYGANLYGANLESANLESANLESANLYGANNKELAYLPIFMKWGIAIKGDKLKIGCKEKTFEEWKTWFSGSEEHSTKRDSEEFRQIHACYLAYSAYYDFLKSKK